MPVELMAIVIATATLLVTLGGGAFAGLAWVVNRVDAAAADNRTEIGNLRADTRDEFEKVRAELVTMRTETRDEFALLRQEQVETKIAIARLEGPRPRLILGNH